MTPDIAVRCVIAPALSLLPAAFDSRPARVMLVAIALQESGLRHRRQVRGPARGYWQFELGGLDGVLRHRAAAPLVAAVVDALDLADAAPVELHHALQHCDLLAAAVARCLLYTLPSALPADEAEGWRQYQSAWRPGKPHPERWPACWQAAQEAIA